MSEIDPKAVEQMKIKDAGIRQVHPGVFEGPHLKGKFYDNYTECLYANINYARERKLKMAGLNDQGQTPEQAKAFERRKKASDEKKRKAEVAAEMAVQNQ